MYFEYKMKSESLNLDQSSFQSYSGNISVDIYIKTCEFF